MDEPTSPNREEAMAHLNELVLDHLGIPRRGQSQHVQELQDHLLPVFMGMARYAWLAASPMPLTNTAIYEYLQSETPERVADIGYLNGILEELGVHDLLRDVSASPDVAMLGSIPLDPYEERLLKTAGHPDPATAVREYLRHAAKDPGLLASPSRKLEEAVEASRTAHSNITMIINLPRADAAGPAPEKPKRRKLFSSLGKLFSGLVLLTGNAILVPTVPIGNIMALPVLGSLAGGIAAVGEGIGQLRREGE